MAKLIYAAMMSLDGHIEGEDGSFGWAEPDPEVHAHVNELQRSVGTNLYGRRMYETLSAWETIGVGPDGSPDTADLEPVFADFAELWRAADKVVYSGTLPSVWTARTRLERSFDVAAVRRLKESAERDLSVSGPDLARHAFRAGLVDEVHAYVFPFVTGGGKPGLPPGGQLSLDLLDERRFSNGAVHLRYAVRPRLAGG
jgi:dihydrofolate reductase